MTRRILATTLLIALAGLTYIQFRLLASGVSLEKYRFDQRAGAALQAVNDSLSKPGWLSGALVERFQVAVKPSPQPSFLADTIQAVLAAELGKRGIRTKFQFAIREKYGQEISVSSPSFDREKFKFGQFSVQLGDRITAGCHCEQILHLDTENLLGYLLSELYYLAVPSVFCLLIILFCLLLLIQILKKEQKLNAIKNDFINNLTHELKTPAFSISLSNKMAKESLAKGDTEKAQKLLQLIENENEKLKAHVEKVLELASLENARFTLRLQKTDVHQLLRAVAEEFAQPIENRGGQLACRFSAPHYMVSADEAHLKNLFRNLLDNALKYSPDAPDITLTTTNEGGQILISVADRGIGIDPSLRQQVFEKFYRAPAPDAHHIKGFGLGLSYAWQVAKAHQAKIWIEGREGGGTEALVLMVNG